MVREITERVVTYWAVQGDRWCNVDGMVDAARAKEWEAAGWRLVTRIAARQVRVFGELLEVEFE